MLISEEEEVVILLVLWEEMSKNDREYWVHPLNLNRRGIGEYWRLVQELKLFETRFYGYFHMSRENFRELYELVGPSITPGQTNYRDDTVGPEERLCLTMRHLTTGDSFKSIAYGYRMGDTTVGIIVEKTCLAIWEVLTPIYMPTPTRAHWRAIAQRYEEVWNFPHCIGAMDGKHIRVQCPANSGSMYFNYKSYYSLVLLAIVDADYRFITVDIGSYGSNSDGGILTASDVGLALINGTLGIPAADVLQNAPELGTMEYSIVADAAFPLRDYIMRPYPNEAPGKMPEDKKVFNYRLSRARRISENVFGILANRYRIFHRVQFANPEKVISVVKATCVLHNFLRTKKCRGTFEEPQQGDVEPDGLRRVPQVAGNRPTGHAMAQREKWKTYFSSPAGEVAWQYAMIRRGLQN